MNSVRWQLRVVMTLFFFLPVALSLSPFARTAEAATISAVKGKRVTIELDGLTVTKGDRLAVYSSQGKKVGTVKVSKVSGSKATGVLSKKSKAQKGDSVRAVDASRAKTKTKTASGKAGKKGHALSVGAALGLSLASFEATLSGTTVALSGNGLSFKAILDYHLFSLLWFRGRLGMEPFNAGGASNEDCTPTAGSGPCVLEITYLGMDFWGRILLMEGNFRPWIGAGLNMQFPMSKTTTVPLSSEISTTSVIAGGAGFDYWVSPTIALMASFDYGMYPSGEGASASAMNISGGVLYSF